MYNIFGSTIKHLYLILGLRKLLFFSRMPNCEQTYTVDLNSEVVVVPFEKLVLDVDKARNLQDRTVSKSFDRLSMCM